MYPPTLHRFVLGPISGAVRIASIHSFIHSFSQPFIHSVSQPAIHSFIHLSYGIPAHTILSSIANSMRSQVKLFFVHSPPRTFLPSSSLQRVVTTRGTGRIPGPAETQPFSPKKRRTKKPQDLANSRLQWLQWPFIRSPM